ncbi:hypothetical protein [Dolichospermum compactum]|uniref:Uncharacterized protein n=1 Tax=Dolichospermum compactum NIES-806 TaxID=1973481 RepID=A0A1Z4V100_9CYAN|nr:hypothetical protein [Dolichospermum compactum]BAZ85102.1 hypothetical protein NIES806_13020 [Dolichospermum compactum NIES-806]BAZ85114.1 hypothetical protein NIES806_13140 [Dolichospermum compactum NIES-806]
MIFCQDNLDAFPLVAARQSAAELTTDLQQVLQGLIDTVAI